MLLPALLGNMLIERLRPLALQGTELATAQVDTLNIKLLKVRRSGDAQHAARPPVPGLQLVQRADLRARHEPAALSVIDTQRLAGAMTQKRPATQAGAGGGVSALHVPTIRTLAAASLAAPIAQIRDAMPRCAGSWIQA